VSKGSTRRYRANRAAVLAGATVCHLCGEPARAGDPLVADHVIPRSKGGHDGIGNLAPAHASCNGRRGDQPIDPASPRIANPPLRVRNPPLQTGEPEPTATTHPHLIVDTDPVTGEKSWWPRWSRDW
jgi:hypothetical protein